MLIDFIWRIDTSGFVAFLPFLPFILWSLVFHKDSLYDPVFFYNFIKDNYECVKNSNHLSFQDDLKIEHSIKNVEKCKLLQYRGLKTWRWGQYIPPKYCYPTTRLKHGVLTLNTKICIVTYVKISLTYSVLSLLSYWTNWSVSYQVNMLTSGGSTRNSSDDLLNPSEPEVRLNCVRNSIIIVQRMHCVCYTLQSQIY
jgi:hypothetical protein